MLDLAAITTKSALFRNESRGSHFKEAFSERNDKEWLKTSIAEKKGSEHKISYKKVDIRYLDPQKREYAKKVQTAPKFKNLPDTIPLPV